MMKHYEQKTVLFSLYTFLIGGILGLIATLLLGESPSVENTVRWAEFTSSNTYTVSYYLLIYAYLIPIPGFWAVHRLFSEY